jgi:hypothetical protein
MCPSTGLSGFASVSDGRDHSVDGESIAMRLCGMAMGRSISGAHRTDRRLNVGGSHHAYAAAARISESSTAVYRSVVAIAI